MRSIFMQNPSIKFIYREEKETCIKEVNKRETLIRSEINRLILADPFNRDNCEHPKLLDIQEEYPTAERPARYCAAITEFFNLKDIANNYKIVNVEKYRKKNSKSQIRFKFTYQREEKQYVAEINCAASYVNKDQDADYLIQLEDCSDGIYYILAYQKRKMAHLIDDTKEE